MTIKAVGSRVQTRSTESFDQTEAAKTVDGKKAQPSIVKVRADRPTGFDPPNPLRIPNPPTIDPTKIGTGQVTKVMADKPTGTGQSNPPVTKDKADLPTGTGGTRTRPVDKVMADRPSGGPDVMKNKADLPTGLPGVPPDGRPGGGPVMKHRADLPTGRPVEKVMADRPSGGETAPSTTPLTKHVADQPSVSGVQPSSSPLMNVRADGFLPQTDPVKRPPVMKIVADDPDAKKPRPPLS